MPSKFTTQALAKSGTNNCRIPVKCVCKDRKYPITPSPLSKLSYFSSEELQLVHSIRESKLTETLKQKQCIFCDKLLGSCTCGSLKAPTVSGKCKFCGKPPANCVCPKWKNKKEGYPSFVPILPHRDQLRCICEKKPDIAGTIDQMKPAKTRPPSTSTPSLTKPTKGSAKEKPKDSERKQGETKKPSKSDSGKLKPPRTSSKPQIVKKPDGKPSGAVKKPEDAKPPSEQKKIEPDKSKESGKPEGQKKVDASKEPERKTAGSKTPQDNQHGDGTKLKPIQPSQNKFEDSEKPKTPQKSAEIIKQPDSSKQKSEKKVEDDKSTVQKPAIPKSSESTKAPPKSGAKDIGEPEDEKISPSIPVKRPSTDGREKTFPSEETKGDGESRKSPCKLSKASIKQLPSKETTDNEEIKIPPPKETKKEEKIEIPTTKVDDKVKIPSTKEEEKITIIPPKEVKETVIKQPSQEKKEDKKDDTHPTASSIKSEKQKSQKVDFIPSTIEDKSIKDKVIEDKLIEDKSIEDRVIKDKIIQDKIIKDKLIDDKLIEDKSIADKSIEGKLIESKINEDESEVLDIVEPDITITIEISDKDEELKYSIEDKRQPSMKEDIVVDEIVKVPEKKIEPKICQCHTDELPIMVFQKCKPCKTKCKKCSRIPRSTSKTLKSDVSKELTNRKLCYCCNNATNTERNVTERGEQYESDTCKTMLLCKNCRKSKETHETNTEVGEINAMVSNKDRNQIKLSKCKATGCMKRSSTFVCSDRKSPKQDTTRKSNGCPKTCQRPSTAGQIHDRRSKEFDSIKKCPGESFATRSMRSSEEKLVRICQPCSEFLPMTSIRSCLLGNSLMKEIGKGRICHCHASVNTDRENLVDRGQQCPKPSKLGVYKCKHCRQAQTGGTYEQDMIASYVASCSTSPEIPPPQQFIIQTLLYQFAGYELDKEPSPPPRRRSLDRSRNPQLKPCENVMRSIEVQVGPSCPPKCEAAQTITTFILTDPRTVQNTTSPSAVEGKINYICGPDIPGIRTKLAMNLNQMPSIDENENCVCKPSCAIGEEESFDQCESAICPYYQDDNSVEKPKPTYTVTKKDKYVFITVTPVQTDPYEPNYYIIFSNPEEDTNKKTEIKGKKTAKSCTKSKQDKTAKKDPLDRFKNQMFSLETLKSKEFLDFFDNKQNLMQNAKVIGPPCNPKNPVCLSALLEKAKEQFSESGKEQKILEDTGCGPDTCEYLKVSQKECCYGNEESKTTTVACGSDHCFHQKELKEFKSKTSNLSPNAIRSQTNKTKDAECGPDTCIARKRKDNTTNDKICISIQTEDIKQLKLTPKEPSKAIVLTIACDAATCTDRPKLEKVRPLPEFCDKEMCTNECEKGDAASQVCLDIDAEQSKKKVDKITKTFEYCDASCSPDDEESEDDSEDSAANDEDSVQQQPETAPIKVKACDDRVCPEKATKSTEKLAEEVQESAKTFDANEQCEDSVCPKKIVNTKLDDKDVFALEMAMKKFIRVNPNSINEDKKV